VAEIDVREANARLGELQVVDVRADYELLGPLGHLPGLLWIPLPELEARAKELAGKGPLLMVCRSGARSRKACEIVAAQGIGPATNLAGGMIAWNRAGLPAAHPAPASLAELLGRVALWLAQTTQKSAADARALLEAAAAPASLEPPTPNGVARAIDALPGRFGPNAPPDLDLSLAAFRGWLAALRD
jgi:rhodanese-related sulfurtransferase